MEIEKQKTREKIEIAKVFIQEKIDEDINNGNYYHEFRATEIKDHFFPILVTALDELVEVTPNLICRGRSVDVYTASTDTKKV